MTYCCRHSDSTGAPTTVADASPPNSVHRNRRNTPRHCPRNSANTGSCTFLQIYLNLEPDESWSRRQTIPRGNRCCAEEMGFLSVGFASTCSDRSACGAFDYARSVDSSCVDATIIVSRRDCRNSVVIVAAAVALRPDAPRADDCRW